MADVTQVKEEPTSVVREVLPPTLSSEVDVRLNSSENLTLEKVCNTNEELGRVELLNAYMVQLSKCDYLDQSDFLREANYLRKLVRSENAQVQTKVAELLLQYLKLMKVNTTYDVNLGGIQDCMLLYKLYQVVHDGSCYHLLPNVKAGELFNKFLCNLLSISSSESVFNSVVKLFQRTVQNVLSKYKRDSGSFDEMGTDDLRVVIAVMKTLLTLTRAFGSPPAPSELLCSLSITVVNSTKAHLCRLYSYNLMAFLIKDVTDKQTLDRLLKGLNSTQYNQVTALVKESNSLNNTCNWRFKYLPVDNLNKKQNDTPSKSKSVYSSPYKQPTPDSVNRLQNESIKQVSSVPKPLSKSPARNYVDSSEKNESSGKRPLSSVLNTEQRTPKKVADCSNEGETSDVKRLNTETANLAADLPNNWYKDLFKTFETNRGEGKGVTVDKNAWKWKNDELVKILKVLENYERVDLESVSGQFVKLFENLLKYESAIPVVINSLNLFKVLLVKGDCDFLNVSKSQLLSDMLFEKLRDSNKKVRDACVQALVEVIKKCKLVTVADSVKRSLGSVSPTCRENVCNFLNGKLLVTSDREFFEKLKELLDSLSDHIKQMAADKVPKVRQAVASLVEVLNDFNQLYLNQPYHAPSAVDNSLHGSVGGKATMQDSQVSNEQQSKSRLQPANKKVSSTVQEAEKQVGSTVQEKDRVTMATMSSLGGCDTTTTASCGVVDGGSEFRVDQVHQESSSSSANNECVSPTLGSGAFRGSDKQERDVGIKTRLVSPSRSERLGVETHKYNTTNDKESLMALRYRGLMALNNLVDVVDSNVLNGFRSSDSRGLDEALYNLCLWMEDHRRLVKSIDFYLLRLVNEFYVNFTSGRTKLMFFTSVCTETLSDEAFAELLLLVKKYKDVKIVESLLSKNNINTNRLLNPLNNLYYPRKSAHQSVTRSLSSTHQTSHDRRSELANDGDRESSQRGNSSGDGRRSGEVSDSLISVLEVLNGLASDESHVFNDDVLHKLVKFLGYFINLESSPSSAMSTEVLSNLDQRYQVARYMDESMAKTIGFARPSKQLKVAYETSASNLQKYVSKELFVCMFQSNEDNKKRACAFWKGFLSRSDKKRDDMLLCESRKDLTSWLSYCMFEKGCDKPVMVVFEVVVDYLVTSGVLFSEDETLWLLESFCSYSEVGKHKMKALSLLSKMTQIMSYSLETVEAAFKYMEKLSDQWVEVLRVALERVVKSKDADEVLVSYVSKKLKFRSRSRGVDERKFEEWSDSVERELSKKDEKSPGKVKKLGQVEESVSERPVESAVATSGAVDKLQASSSFLQKQESVSEVDTAQALNSNERSSVEMGSDYSKLNRDVKRRSASQLQQQDRPQSLQKSSQEVAVDSKMVVRSVQARETGGTVAESKNSRGTFENDGRSLKGLNEKYKLAMASLETVTTNASLETMETLTTNDSKYDSTQNFQASNSHEFNEKSASEALNENADPLEGVQESQGDVVSLKRKRSVDDWQHEQVSPKRPAQKAASSPKKKGYGDSRNVSTAKHQSEVSNYSKVLSYGRSQREEHQGVSRSVEKSSQQSPDKENMIETSNDKDSISKSLLDEVILDEDVALELESCRRLSKQIVENPLPSVNQQPYPKQTKYLSASLEETRYVFVKGQYPGDEAEDSENVNASDDDYVGLQEVDAGTEYLQYRKQCTINSNLVYDDEEEGSDESVTDPSVSKIQDKSTLALGSSHSEEQVATVAPEHYEKGTFAYDVRGCGSHKQLQMQQSDLEGVADGCDKQTGAHKVEYSKGLSHDGKPEGARLQRYDKQTSTSMLKGSDEETSKYHPYIQSLTGDLAPSMSMENDDDSNCSEEKEHLETVSDDSTHGHEGSTRRTASHSDVSKSQHVTSERKGHDLSCKPFTTDVSHSSEFVDSDPDCLRDELGLNLVETVLTQCSLINNACLVNSYKEYQSLSPTLCPGDLSKTLSHSFKSVLRHKNALKGTFLRLLTPPLVEASHNALLLLSKRAFKNLQNSESFESTLDAMGYALEVFKLVTSHLQEKFVLRFCNVVTTMLSLPKELFKDKKLYSLVSSLVSENALRQSKAVMYKLLFVMIEVSMESLEGELDRSLMAKLRFTKILQMQILVGLKKNEAGYVPESETLKAKHMDFINRLESFIRKRRAQNVDKVIRTSNYIISTI